MTDSWHKRRTVLTESLIYPLQGNAHHQRYDGHAEATRYHTS